MSKPEEETQELTLQETADDLFGQLETIHSVKKGIEDGIAELEEILQQNPAYIQMLKLQDELKGVRKAHKALEDETKAAYLEAAEHGMTNVPLGAAVKLRKQVFFNTKRLVAVLQWLQSLDDESIWKKAFKVSSSGLVTKLADKIHDAVDEDGEHLIWIENVPYVEFTSLVWHMMEREADADAEEG